MSSNKKSKKVHTCSNNSKAKHVINSELKKNVNVNWIISMLQTEKEVHEQIIAMFQKELAQLPDGGVIP